MRTKPLYRRYAALELLESRRLLSSTYYVSPSGNDNSAGSTSAPFLTLQHGVSVLQAGDTLNVEAGKYAGFVIGWDGPGQPPYGLIAGTAGSPITIQADPAAAAGSVIIDSRDNKTADGIDLEPGCNYININGFTVVDGDGSITRAGIRVTGSDFVNVTGNTTTGLGTWGIFTGFASDGIIQDNVCSGSVAQHGIYVSNSPVDEQILNNTCFGNNDCGIQINADASQGGTGIATGCVVKGNIVYDNGASGGAAINLDGVQNSVVENNLLYANIHTGIALYQIDGAAGPSGDLVAGNTVVMPSSSKPAIELSSTVGPNTIFDNIFIGQTDFDTGNQTSANYIASSVPNGLFVNAGANNYELAAGSAAAGIGVISFNGFAAPATDILGEAFAGDTGAYQNIGQKSTGPTVSALTINDGSAQRSMITSLTVTFSEAVTLSS
jgi:Periplasmic copper-binding protein (NosD)